ncbi:MAG: FkbM family methyltransferase [Gammaproteobacteria bacterium]
MSVFDLIAQGLKGERPLLFFGAGQNACDWIEHLAKHQMAPVAIIDETVQKQGKDINGIPIVSPQDATKNWGVESIILSSVFVPRVAYQNLISKIRSFGYSFIGCVSQLQHFLPDVPFYYFLGSNLRTEIIEMRKNLSDHWVDTVSIEHVNAFFHAQTALDPSFAASPRKQDYFLHDLIRVPDGSIYVDAGAYRGDTIEKYFELLPFASSQIYAFEPDPSNFAALQEYINTLPEADRQHIQIKQQGVGATNSKIRFQPLGNFSSRASEIGSEEIEIIRLDDTIPQDKSYFIKFDVEGAEMDALFGCESIIRKGLSAIAVSVYHRAMDWFEVSKYFFEKFPDVQLFFRTLDENGMDSVIYAIPKAWVK